MKDLLLNYLICPSCMPNEMELDAHVLEKTGDDIWSGSLECKMCHARYPIEDGIAVVLSGASGKVPDARNPYEGDKFISSYLWSHYADLWNDDEANTAYGQWAGLLGHGSGLALDAGCAVGRFAFEMSGLCEFVVGVDLSMPFIRLARRLMIERRLDVVLPEEGVITRSKTIHLPEAWNSDKVEFIVADIQSLPFHSRTFSMLSSLNLVDKVPFPLIHLKEVNRVAKETQAQFLFSDPFSWSAEVSEQKEWLGGTAEGPFRGQGLKNVESLLTGKVERFSPVWSITEAGNIWWKIRNHANHFELIRSCYVKAKR